MTYRSFQLPNLYVYMIHRNLAMTRPPDTYVKLCLVSSSGQEMSRSKTSIRRGQPNPLFKETFMFQVILNFYKGLHNISYCKLVSLEEGMHSFVDIWSYSGIIHEPIIYTMHISFLNYCLCHLASCSRMRLQLPTTVVVTCVFAVIALYISLIITCLSMKQRPHNPPYI